MKSINGLSLKEMIISGANNLFNCYPEVDALNVFPVPDGDTGTNMNLTISSGAKEVANKNDNNVYNIAKSFSKGLLMGARGNSGVILSQIFRGFAMALEGKETIEAVDLAAAFAKGRDVAYKAVMKPVEGTILTVIRESSTLLSEKVEKGMSIEDCFNILIDEARASLNRTPELLPVLKEVGVVDSGGTGLLKVLEGFQSAVNGKVVEKVMATVTESTPKAGSQLEGDEFGYCTEFLLRLPSESSSMKKEYNESRFNSFLQSHGNSIVSLKDDDIVKVHIHTLNPGEVLAFAIEYGEFVKVKIENMSEQHTQLVEEGKNPDKKKEEPLKEYAIIAVAAGKGVEDLFKQYRADYIVTGGQTMNPSTEDFVAAINKVHAKNIIILPNNSNIVMAANQACQVVEDVNVKVVPTKTIPQGLTACMMFNPEDTIDNNVEEMTGAISSVKTGQVTYAIKDTTVDGVEVKKDQFIGLSGRQIICCNKNKIKTTIKTIESMVDDMTSVITILVGQDASEDEAHVIEEYINEKYSDVEIEIKKGDQPVYHFIVGVE